MKKALILCSLVCSITFADSDWRIDAFESAQAIFAEFDQQEAELLTKLDPNTMPFYQLWLPMRQAHRERGLIAFHYKIENMPETIRWNDIWEWSQGVSYSKEEELLARVSTEYTKAHNMFLEKRDALKQNQKLIEARNKAGKHYCEELQELSNLLDEKLDKLQSKVNDRIEANKSLEATPYSVVPQN